MSDRLPESYQRDLLAFLDANGVGGDAALDFASGPNLRHARIYERRFNRVVANDHEKARERIEERVGNRTAVKRVYGDFTKIDFEGSFDLAGFCWPEMCYYDYFVANAIAKRKLLAPNGFLIFCMADDRVESEGEAAYRCALRLFVNGHEQFLVRSADVEARFRELGCEVVASMRGSIDEDLGYDMGFTVEDALGASDEALRESERRLLADAIERRVPMRKGAYSTYLVR